MYGMDISSYQSKLDLTKGNYDFAIMKATEGVGFTDKSFHNFAVQLTKLGKLVGCYHFARPDLHGTISGMEEEADWFIKTVKDEGLLHKAILVLDWEKEPTDREDLVQAWVLRVENQTGVTPFIYGSRSKMNGWKNWWAMSHCPIWMAVWPSIQRYQVGANPGLTIPRKTVNWSIWQYSSTGKYPDFSGNVDLDYCEFNKETWLKMAGNKEDPIEEVINDDLKWAIEIGLFFGYGNGMYGPKNPITREQVASVLHRYNSYIIRECHDMAKRMIDNSIEEGYKPKV